MKTTNINEILSAYGESHQNPTNQKIHKVCVPLIMWSLLGLLSEIPGAINWAYVVVLGGMLFYLRFKNASVVLVALVQIIPMMLAIHFLRDTFDYRHWLGIFVAAWIGQFIGHKIEGKKPSFFEDIFFLLIGPLWVLKPFIKT